MEAFREIWRDMGGGQALGDKNETVLKVVADWARDERNSVRLTQVLLMDPEGAWAHGRPCARAVFDRLHQAWSEAGFRPEDLQLLQVMLLAASRAQGAPGHPLAALMDGGWDLQAGRERLRIHLERWRRARLEAELTIMDDPDPSTEVDEELETNAEGASAMQQDLLWWSQARYCHKLRTPYRRIDNADAALWWAASEAAELGVALPAEPAAALLVETLRAMGQPVDEEKRTLKEWLDAFRGLLRGPPAYDPGKRLAALAQADALGLPVTWIRINAASEADGPAMEEAIGLPLASTLDRGEWATWVYRELVLDLRLSS